ncbi:MINE1 [Arabidopsis thaliana]|uniref:MINE1 n=1 Tax=Arabidopsis thaliana TaxID=3702 RepID=A0A178W285_ARATH|nr:MINE1 [Arabidopsis thaliana]
MAMSSGTLRISATLVSPYHHHHRNRLSLPSSSSKVRFSYNSYSTIQMFSSLQFGIWSS